MKKLLYIIPLLLFSLVAYSAKDIDDSFDRYTIAIPMADTLSMDADYEEPLYDELTRAGHTVTKVPNSYLSLATYDGTNEWTDFDLVIIPRFAVCPTVDTSHSTGIGAVSVIVMEDSLWDDFGFDGKASIITEASDSLFYFNYTSKYVIKTDTTGTSLDTIYTGAHLDFIDFLAYNSTSDSIYFGDDTCFYKIDIDGGGVDSFGVQGSGSGEFTNIESIVRDNNYFYIADWQRVVRTNWGGGDWVSSSEWDHLAWLVAVEKGRNDTIYAAGKKAGNTYGVIYKGTISGGTFTWHDSLVDNSYRKKPADMHIDTTGVQDTLYYLENEKDKIYKLTWSAYQDSYATNLTNTINFDYDFSTDYFYIDQSTQGYIEQRLWTDASKDTIADDNASGDRTYVGALKKTVTPSFSETATKGYVSNTNDSLTTVFTSGLNSLYRVAQTVPYIDATNLLTGNILVKDSANTDNIATVVIDTIDGEKRIAFSYNRPDTLSHEEKQGWTLVNRAVGRLKGSEADSIFRVVIVNKYTTGSDYYTHSEANFLPKNYFETNMHLVELTTDEYLDSIYYDASADSWHFADIVWVAEEAGVDGWDSLKQESQNESAPVIFSASGEAFIDGDLFDDYTETSLAVADSIKSIKAGSHWINYRLNQSSGDTIYPYFGFSSYPELVESDERYYTVAGTSVEGDASDVFTGTQFSGGGTATVKTMLAHDTYKWVATTLLHHEHLEDNVRALSSVGWDIVEKSLLWMLLSTPDYPTGVTFTPITTDSIKIEWTDNADNEDGYLIYLENGGEYSGTQYLLDSEGANTTSDTVGPFWPPNSKWFISVAAYTTAEDTVFSSATGDSAWTLAAVPPAPFVEPATDTSWTISLLGHEFRDVFTDTNLTDWSQKVGTWSSDTLDYYMWVLTDGGANVASVAYSGDVKDVEFELDYRFSDTTRISAQSLNFYFLSDADSLGGTTPSVYVDSGYVQLRSYNSGTLIDTLIDYSWEYDYHWHKLGIKRDWTSNPSDTAVTWTLYFDDDSVGVKSFPSLPTAEMWDPAASVFTSGTYSWVKYGANSMSNDGNELKIGYNNHSWGAYVFLKDAADITDDLVVGEQYILSCSARIHNNDGSLLGIGYGSDYDYSGFLNNETAQLYSFTFDATHATSMILRCSNMTAGDTTWIDDITLKKIDDTQWLSPTHMVLEASHADIKFDNLLVRGFTPSGNHDSTQYAIEDTVDSEWVQLVSDANDTLGASEDWEDYHDWGGESGFIVEKDTAEDSIVVRSKARNEGY